MNLSNISIKNVGNRRNDVLLKLAEAINTIAKAVQTDATTSIGMYVNNVVSEDEDTIATTETLDTGSQEGIHRSCAT